jgi:hypothetical protein
VTTRKGTLVAITDEGTGFDAALTFRRFQEQQSYFVNHGSGFRNLHRALSTVSYQNGGRTVLLCFRPKEEPEDASSSCPAPAYEPTMDAQWILTCLSELPEFADGSARLESCRVYATGGDPGDDCGKRYVLRVASRDGGVAETRILTGRLHATEAAAKADFEAATRLHEVNISKSLLIPKPVARPAGEPRLVLYDFDPWMNMWEYLAYRRRLKAVRHCADRVGRALASLHQSRILLPGVEPDCIEEGLQARVARAETTLQSLRAGADLVNRFLVSVQQFQRRATFMRQRTLAPIHGAFGWDCIHFGVDGCFYLSRFEACRRSDPGLDLGGFAADLLCFMLGSDDDGAYRMASDAFLSKYNSHAEHPIDEHDFQFYIALALCERLRRAEPSAKADTGRLLEALNAVLSDQGRVGASDA